MISIPESVIISDVTVSHNTPSFMNEMMSLHTESKGRNIHRFEGEFTATMPTLKSQKAWTSFLLRLGGRAGTFSLDLPLHFKSDITTNPTLSTGASTGNNTISISTTEQIDDGSCFTLPNDSKIYHLLEDVDGNGSYSIFPPLQQSQLTGAIVNFKTPVISCRIDNDKPQITHSEQGIITETTLSFIEAF